VKDYNQSKKWSDRFIPAIKRILSEVLISEAPFKEDANYNTDLMVLDLKPYRIACRIRNNDCLKDYGDQFTIRDGRPSGAKSEFVKIRDGWGDIHFYGIANAAGTELVFWVVGDLNVLRIYIESYTKENNGKLPGILKTNKDGTTFRAFYYRDVPNFIIASSLDDKWRKRLPE